MSLSDFNSIHGGCVLLTIFIQFNPVPTPGVQSMWVLGLRPAY